MAAPLSRPALVRVLTAIRPDTARAARRLCLSALREHVWRAFKALPDVEKPRILDVARAALRPSNAEVA